ncbi:MAG: SDR family NAD(P)-dependent oxidoreductase [Opitutaceae bacterium]|nr:SDR family NAD(P)-dependent oxidoreductase [Opitutaceae bacterium]
MKPKNNPRSSARSAGSSPVVLITGASQGIGAATAQVFAREERCRLALVARNVRNLRAVARACRRLGAAAVEVFPCDVGDEAAVAAMADAVTGRFGGVDAIINNAGKFFSAPFLKMSIADFDRIVRANLRSIFLVSRALVPGMVRRRRGDVFNVSSIAGLQAYPGGAAYSSAKFGVTGLSQVMRAELKDKGVRVCCVCPGATFTPSWAGSGVDRKRMMPADDVARAILDVYRLSRRSVVEELVLRPQLGDV